MKYTSTSPLSSLLVLVGLTANCLAFVATRATFSVSYDDPEASMDTVACSDPNGIAGRFPTFGSLPTFPNIGGSFAISGFSPPKCGGCWILNIAGGSDIGIPFIAIDVAGEGFDLSEETMLALTNGTGVTNGFAEIQASEQDAILCGM